VEGKGHGKVLSQPFLGGNEENNKPQVRPAIVIAEIRIGHLPYKSEIPLLSELNLYFKTVITTCTSCFNSLTLCT
jgi:hypothetical protein